MRTERVIAYIDGFSLYHGLKDKGWNCYYWLDLKKLCQNLISANQALVDIKYHTSRIKAPPGKKRRQNTYLEALREFTKIQPFYGKYEYAIYECQKCAHKNRVPVEKMADVRLAVNMVADAFLNKYDTVFLITGDKDFVPAVERLKGEYPQKQVTVVFPPMRTNDNLRFIADRCLHITEIELKKSLLPDEVPRLDGYILKRPPEWM